MATNIKTMNGIKGDVSGVMIKSKIICRFTSDKYGETLSLEDGKTLLIVDYKEVEKVINKGRKNKI